MFPKDFTIDKIVSIQFFDGEDLIMEFAEQPMKPILSEYDVIVEDINILVPNKVVEVTFADGTKTKSVCREPDVFSLETAISICISKKLMGGSSEYNKCIKNALRFYDDKLKREEREKQEQECIAKKKAKRAEYKKRRAEKKEQTEKERLIEIQKEAYIRAMKEIADTKE